MKDTIRLRWNQFLELFEVVRGDGHVIVRGSEWGELYQLMHDLVREGHYEQGRDVA